MANLPTNLPTRAGSRRSAFALLLALPLLLMSCNSGTKQGGNQATNVQPTPATTPAAPRLTIDGGRAFEHVRKQVEFGPRPAGSPELARTRDYLAGELKSYGLNVSLDEFTAKTPVGERKMVNVVAELPGESADVLIFASHYDTKLYKEFRFVGANDGASSTATLLEMARALATSGRKPRMTYWFVLFDGEEAFCADWDECKNPDGPDNTYGSRHMVRSLKEKGDLGRVRALILMDMIGYKNLRLGRDEEMSARWLIDEVWRAAEELGHGGQFVEEYEGVGGDDHEPFMREGVQSLDIIQLSTYPYWHKAEDTLDKISPESLKAVGDVLLASLPKIEERLLRPRAAL